MDYTNRLVALDLQLAGVVVWEEQLHEFFDRYGVDSFEDLTDFISDEEVYATITLGEALLILNR